MLTAFNRENKSFTNETKTNQIGKTKRNYFHKWVNENRLSKAFNVSKGKCSNMCKSVRLEDFH